MYTFLPDNFPWLGPAVQRAEASAGLRGAGAAAGVGRSGGLVLLQRPLYERRNACARSCWTSTHGGFSSPQPEGRRCSAWPSAALGPGFLQPRRVPCLAALAQRMGARCTSSSRPCDLADTVMCYRVRWEEALRVMWSTPCSWAMLGALVRRRPAVIPALAHPPGRPAGASPSSPAMSPDAALAASSSAGWRPPRPPSRSMTRALPPGLEQHGAPCDCRRATTIHAHKAASWPSRCTRAQLPRVRGSDVTSIHKHMVLRYFNSRRGSQHPCFRDPICPWGAVRRAVDQDKVQRFAQQIRQHRSSSHLEIDDMYTLPRRLPTQAKFPTPVTCVPAPCAMPAFSAHALVHPLVNYNLSRLRRAWSGGCLCANPPAGRSRALSGRVGAVLDFTRPARPADWFQDTPGDCARVTPWPPSSLVTGEVSHLPRDLQYLQAAV